MEANSFWLISVEESTLSVSLMLKSGLNFSIGAIGSQIDWDENDVESFVSALDTSLSQAASDALISSDAEPQDIAIILPPFWVGADGRILPDRLKIIGTACKKLELKPIGFIPNDEAVIEQSNSNEGFPSSFILINLSKNSFVLSLVYLGKIKDRIRRNFDGEFNPSLIETVLLDLKTESTLPPQIIVFGSHAQQSIQLLKNYAWVGKKDVETFLHFPDVSAYTVDQLINIYAQSIASQLKISLSNSIDTIQKAEVVDDEEFNQYSVETEPEETVVTDSQNDFINNNNYQLEANLIEIDPAQIGFVSSQDVENIIPVPDFSYNTPESVNNFDNQTEIINPPFQPQVQTHFTQEPIKENKKVTLPKFKLNFPKFLPKVSKISYSFLAFLPLIILIPFFLTKANIEIFITPFSFSKKINITLDANTTSFDSSKKVIPVEKKEFSVSTSASIPTTGKKTVGEKSQGEIIIYNKQEKVQNLPKGTKITDSSGKKYELANAVSVAASTSNLDQGIITLGQTKTVVQASEIGPEYNIDKSVQISFTDFSENQIIAKIDSTLSGGTKEEISAVSSEDKTNLQKKINEAIGQETNNKIKQDLSSLSGVINGSLQNKKSRIDYSREVGETANELSATVDATVSVFIFNPDLKSSIINNVLEKEANFSEITVNPDDFTFTFDLAEINTDNAKGSLQITGIALPKVEPEILKNKLSGKFIGKAGKIIEKDISRVYNYQIKTNMSFIEPVNPLPFLKKNINISLKK